LPATAGRLLRDARLTDKPQFDRVYREGQRVSDALFTVVARANDVGHARLGLSVGIRAAGCAVNRNRVKRVVRERFRLSQQELPPVDLVVNAKPGSGSATRAQLATSISALFVRMSQRCAQS
jgi:ribonuclease P protein component